MTTVKDVLLWLPRLFEKNWRAIDEEQKREVNYFRVLWICALVAIVLTLQYYYGNDRTFKKLVPRTKANKEYWSLWSQAWWAGWRIGGYMLIPMVVILLTPGERLRDYYLSFRGFVSHIKTYLILFALILPVVYIASQTPSFAKQYPFYKLANRSAFDFWIWELLYAGQFLALEFFFRGFMLRSLAPSMGSMAIFVMCIPYCMIHFQKPITETIGAIGAGLILGTIAMRTRSIWGGVLLHVGVALSMDLFTVAQCPDPPARCR